MNNYEIESKLTNKAEKWELNNLQSEIQELKRKIDNLKSNINNLQNINDNRYYAFDKLFNIIAEHPQFKEFSNEIYELKGNL